MSWVLAKCLKFVFLYYSKKVLHHQIYTTCLSNIFFLRMPYLNFKFYTALAGSIQYLTQQTFARKHVEICQIAFSVKTKIL